MDKVLSCVEFDPITETCQAQEWADPPTGLPTLTVEEGSAIGMQLVWVFVTIKVVSYIREAYSDRIGP